MKGSPRTIVPLALVALAGSCASGVGGSDWRPDPWLADLDALQAHMDLAYANLEWVVERRGLDLVALDGRTRATIRRARSDGAAARALREFVVAFDDPHFGLQHRRSPWTAWAFRLFDRGDRAAKDPPAFAPDATGRDVCEALGYRDRDHDFELAVDELHGWTPLPDDGAFPAGTFALGDGRRIGLLRIEHFGENGYRSACAEAWAEARRDRAGDCGGQCLEAFRRTASDALARGVAARVESLRAAGIAALVVDVTGNGGGTEWVDPVTRIFSDRPLRSMRATTVRHPRAIEPTRGLLAAVEATLGDRTLPGLSRATLEEARRRLDARLAEARAPCDRAPLWRGGDPGCSQLFASPSYATGIFDWLPSDALAGVDDELRAELYSPYGRDVPEGVWSGPLRILADGGSASATEAFVAMLRDNGAAIVIGEPTWGAGCGFTNGGLPLQLPNSGLAVWMPDCARFRIDGTNEIEGIEPDVEIPWSELGGSERARALVEALAAR